MTFNHMKVVRNMLHTFFLKGYKELSNKGQKWYGPNRSRKY